MSRRFHQEVSTWEDIERSVRCTTSSIRGHRMSRRAQVVYWDTLVLLTLVWKDLLSRNGCSFSYRRWLQNVATNDMSEVFGCFAEADSILLHMWPDGLFGYDDFKRRLSQKFPRSGALIGPLREILVQWYQTGTISLFSDLHQAFVFANRLTLPGLRDLKDMALADYVRGEERLQSVDPTEEEAAILERWFPRLMRRGNPILDHFEPQHGPGSVAEGTRDLLRKYEILGTDCRLRYLDGKVGDRSASPRPRGHFERCARVKFVPKSWNKLRTICMEPATLMWYQQGFLSSIDRYLKRHRSLRFRVDLNDQEPNRVLAFEGSIDGSIATIDLSAASDSVSWSLIKRWFRNTNLREALWCTRSVRSSLPDGSEIQNQKFAPMGSALCFPVECLCFLAMAEATIREMGDEPSDSIYRVFGDDIIIEAKYVEALSRRLLQNGFLLNQVKSFAEPLPRFNYRESCGAEFLDGEDVTPIRLSRKFRGFGVGFDASQIQGLISFANDCYGHLPSVRLFLIRELMKLPNDKQVLFDRAGESGLFSPTPTNWHLKKRRRNIDYQIDEVACGFRKESFATDDENDDVRLFEQLRLTRCRRQLLFPEDLVVARIHPPRRASWTSHFQELL